MRVVVIGATGNVGTSVLEALRDERAVEEIVAVARRGPQSAHPATAERYPRTHFVPADIVRADLVSLLRGADAVVHLAWLIQPGRRESVTRAVNVEGSKRVFDATVEAKVPALIYASSVGAYSPGPKDRLVDESWPTDGISSSFYARHKAATERLLDRLEQDAPDVRVVRMRPGLIFKREAATEIRRLFAGPLLPSRLLRPQLIPVVPDVPRLRFQAVHSLDVGDAYRRALLSDSRGAFNVAADPVIGPSELAGLLRARPVRVPARVLRAAASSTYLMHLQPTEPGWVDMALAVPLMDASRARAELGWSPAHSSLEALSELLEGLCSGSDFETPPLSRRTTKPARLPEVASGIGLRAPSCRG